MPKSILVVDDEPEYRLITRSILNTEGYNVVLAENGQDALDRLKEGSVDLVIADIYMPVMDGIKLNRTVRAMPQFEKLPFLFVSAFDDQHTLSAIQDPRQDGFLRKARPIEELLEWVAYLLIPEEDRPKIPPGGRIAKKGGEPRTPRSGSSTPIY